MKLTKARQAMASTGDHQSIIFCYGGYKYKILAATLLVQSNQPNPEPHDGEWKAIVTIYKTSNHAPDIAQSFPQYPHYGATEAEARAKAHEYGWKLVVKDLEGLDI